MGTIRTMIPVELRAPRPIGRLSRALDDEIRTYWGAAGWTCQLCGQPIPQALRFPHPRSWTKDHIIPLAYGGGNDLGNFQPAHLSCNKRRYLGHTKPPRRPLNTSRRW